MGHIIYIEVDLDIHSSMLVPLSIKEYNYGLRISKSSSCLTKFLVNIIHIYISKIIYYENIFLN